MHPTVVFFGNIGVAVPIKVSLQRGSILVLFFFNIYFWESASGGGADRGGQRILSGLYADRLTAASLMWGSNSRIARS